MRESAKSQLVSSYILTHGHGPHLSGQLKSGFHINESNPILQAKEAVVSALSPGSEAAAAAVKWMHEFQTNGANVEVNCMAAFVLIREQDDSHFSPQFKLFALNSVESLIKVAWYDMSSEFRERVKREFESLISEPGLSVNFLSDGLSRCVVEVMIREWSENWPQLLPLLLSKEKNTSVLNVFWRLAEDVGVQFKPKNARRRREILSTITDNLNLILSYIWNCMQSDQSVLCLTSLRTLAAYLEWMPIDVQVLRFLCHVLTSDCQPENHFLTQSQVIACDCLISILSRKKIKAQESEVTFNLLTQEILSIVFRLLRSVD